jgi:hypothetical protein
MLEVGFSEVTPSWNAADRMVVGTFPVFDNLKPKIVRIEFAPLPVNHKDMVSAVKDNGKLRFGVW